MASASGGVVSTGSPADSVSFVHNSERQLARLFDFYGVAWQYEPHTFVLRRHRDGRVREAFSPDFYLPAHQRYLEVTTSRQELVTRKNRKVRLLRELHPELDVRLVYQRDYLHLLRRFGLDAPDQLAPMPLVTPAIEVGPGLLDLGPVAPPHPASPAFRHSA